MKDVINHSNNQNTGQNAPGQMIEKMMEALKNDDQEAAEDLFDAACAIQDNDNKATVLNAFLVMPGHYMHQAVVWEIQQLRHPSSVAVIRQVLENGFSMFDYTCSEDAAIAKWFSHALAKIGTDEAIHVIGEFAQSSNPDIAMEMKYRLSQISK